VEWPFYSGFTYKFNHDIFIRTAYIFSTENNSSKKTCPPTEPDYIEIYPAIFVLYF